MARTQQDESFISLHQGAKSLEGSESYIPLYYRSKDGLKLFLRDYRPEKPTSALPIVCLAGLSRNSADFHNLALHFSRHPTTPRRVIAFDYRGRGKSEHDRNWQNYDVRIEAGDILDGLAALDVEKADIIGTSRGGLITLAISLMRPALLGRVILNDIGPRIEEIGLLRIKTYLDKLDKFKSWDDLHQTFRPLAREGFPAITERDYEEFVGAIFEERGGKPYPLFDMALLNPLKNMDFSQPLPELWHLFNGLGAVRLDILRGERSDLLSEETARKMAKLHPDARLHTIPGQAHAPLTNAKSVIGVIDRIMSR